MIKVKVPLVFISSGLVLSLFTTFLLSKSSIEFTMLALLIILILTYIIFSILINSIKLFLFTSIILTMIGFKYHINYVNYIGGIGASDFYFGTPHLVVILGLISLVIHYSKTSRRIPLFHGRNLITMLFFMFSTIFCATIAPFKEASLTQLNFYITVIILYFLWIIAFSSLNSEESTKVLLYSFSFLVSIQLLFSILQILKGNSLGFSVIGEGDVIQRLGVPFPSVTGTFGHPGILSLLYVICISLFFPSILQKGNYILLIALIVSFVGLILTFSRTSLLIVLPILFFQWIFVNKIQIKISKMKILVLSLLGLIILISFGDFIGTRFLSLVGNTDDNQVQNRFDHYIIAWEYIKQNPFLGYGLNNWAYVTSHIGLASAMGYDSFFYLNPVHNVYLLMWFEGGLPLLLSFIGILVKPLHTIILNLRNVDSVQIGIFGSIIGVIMYSFTGWGLISGGQLMYCLFLILAFINSYHLDTANNK